MTFTPLPLATSPAYDPVARLLHWSMALLIILAFGLGLIVDLLPKTWEHGIVETHKAIGLGLLALLATRIAWRLGHRPPAPTNGSPLAERASSLGHAGLYALMLAVPLIGLAYAVLRGQGLDLGLFSIPPIAAAASRTVSRPVKEIHEWAAYALVGLALLHALAALWHHVVLKDRVLRRMLPRG